MAMFLVVRRQAGPAWDPARPMEEQSSWREHVVFMNELEASGFIVLAGPLSDDRRVAYAVEAASADEARATLERDPWAGSHLVFESIDPWTIVLDSRALSRP